MICSCALATLAIAANACDRKPPRAPDLVDAAYAFGWDTTAWIAALGNCFGANEGGRPSRGWTPQPGRYILTLVDTFGRTQPLRMRGRLWLAATAADDSSPGTRATLPADDTREHPFAGATDFPFDSLKIPGLVWAPGAPPQQSLDPIQPGVLVVHRNHASLVADPDFVLQVGTRANDRGRQVSDSGGVAFAIRGGSGDGFWGMWGARAAGKARRGFFCAGWIDVFGSSAPP